MDTEAERRRHMQRLEERSYRQMQRDRRRAAEERDRDAAGHERAAKLHDRLADLGWGDVADHRAQAGLHREDAEAARAPDDRDRTLPSGDSTE
jgi:uncharacterized membrane protein